MRLHRLFPLAALAVLATAGCGRDTPPATPQGAPVRVVEAAPASFARPILATGLVRAATETPLAFKTSGIVAAVRVTAGQSVKAGHVLAELNTSDLDAALAQARESLGKQERDLARAESLRAKGMISHQAEQDVRAQRDIARATLAAAEFNRRQAAIVAPADGLILEKRAEARETVASGQPVLVFGQLDRGWVVKAGLPPRDALALKVGDDGDVRLDGMSTAVPGRVNRIAAASDPRTGTVEVEVALPGDVPRLVSGMVANLTLRPAQAEGTSGLAVPVSALLEGNAGQGKVFVLEAGADQAKRVTVRTGRLIDGRIEIIEGIAPGTRVVSEGAAWLDDGARVRILP